jgi:hypothetical protein
MHMTTPLTFALAVLMVAQVSPAQRPDFSGHWRLVTATERGKPIAHTSDTAPARELIVSQDAASLTIAHGAAAGTCPKPAVHQFRRHGSIGSAVTFTSDVFWFGNELVITSSSRGPEGADGRARVHEYSEKWSLDAGERLVIYFSETRTGAGSTWGTLTYTKTDVR